MVSHGPAAGSPGRINAAAVMTHHVLTALKRLALPEKWLTARGKRLRFRKRVPAVCRA